MRSSTASARRWQKARYPRRFKGLFLFAVIVLTAAWLLLAGATGHSLFGAAATPGPPTKTVPATPPGPPTSTAAAQSFAPVVLDTAATPTFGPTKTPIPPP